MPIITYRYYKVKGDHIGNMVRQLKAMILALIQWWATFLIIVLPVILIMTAISRCTSN